MLPDFERTDAIGSYWGNLKTRTFGGLMMISARRAGQHHLYRKLDGLVGRRGGLDQTGVGQSADSRS